MLCPGAGSQASRYISAMPSAVHVTALRKVWSGVEVASGMVQSKLSKSCCQLHMHLGVPKMTVDILDGLRERGEP